MLTGFNEQKNAQETSRRLVCVDPANIMETGRFDPMGDEEFNVTIPV